MPYELRMSGEKHCVAKKGGDIIKGACHATEQEAKAQMRALYAAEKKEIDMELKALEDDGVMQEASTIEKQLEQHDTKCGYAEQPYTYVPWGVTSLEDYNVAKEAEENAQMMVQTAEVFRQIVRNIVGSDEIDDKASAIPALGNEFADMIDGGMEDHKDIDEKAVLSDPA